MGPLGWSLNRPKDGPFDSVFTSLGVEFRLIDQHEHRSSLSQQPGRAAAIEEQCHATCDSQHLATGRSRELRARVQYAVGQILGRCTGKGTSVFRTLPPRLQDSLHRSRELVLRWPPCMLRETPPRQILLDGCPPILIWTDGACEEHGSLVTCGGVIVDGVSQPVCLGLVVPDNIVRPWRAGGNEQVICQAELLPVLIARPLWG